IQRVGRGAMRQAETGGAALLRFGTHRLDEHGVAGSRGEARGDSELDEVTSRDLALAGKAGSQIQFVFVLTHCGYLLRNRNFPMFGRSGRKLMRLITVPALKCQAGTRSPSPPRNSQLRPGSFYYLRCVQKCHDGSTSSMVMAAHRRPKTTISCGLSQTGQIATH